MTHCWVPTSHCGPLSARAVSSSEFQSEADAYTKVQNLMRYNKVLFFKLTMACARAPDGGLLLCLYLVRDLDFKLLLSFRTTARTAAVRFAPMR